MIVQIIVLTRIRRFVTLNPDQAQFDTWMAHCSYINNLRK